MARRGKFGRLPAAAPSLTSTIVSIAHEMAAAEDRNIMDAWQNGGTYKGNPVTDKDVLAHWQQRMRGVDHSDPLYDQYKLNYDHLDYQISESKQSTLYAQGKISDRAMGQFYLNWAKKIPKDSEFYRQLQRDGARFIQASTSRARSGAAANKDQAFVDSQANVAKSLVPGDLLTQVLTNLAVVNGLLDPTDTKGLAHLSDPAQFEFLIGQMSRHPDDPIYVDGGTVVTGKMVTDALTEVDPTFKPAQSAPSGGPSSAANARQAGGLTSDYIIRTWQGAHQTNLDLAAAAAAAGHKGEWKGGHGSTYYLKQAGLIQENVRDVGLWGIAPAYNMIVKQRDQVLNDPTATLFEKSNALNTAAQSLDRLARTRGLDARTITTLGNEANANAGVKTGGDVSTFGQDYLGIGTPPGKITAVSQDSANDAGGNQRISTLSAQLLGEVQELAARPFDPTTQSGYMATFGTRDSVTGAFTFDPKGTEIGVVDGQDVVRSGAPAVAIAIPQANGKSLLVWATGHEITAEARDGEGNPIKTGRVGADGKIVDLPATLGTVYTYNHGGDTVHIYQTTDGVFSPVSPFTGVGAEREDNNGNITIDFTNTALVPPNSGNYEPSKVALAIRSAAGWNPDTDFNTPIIASLFASPDLRAAATGIISDPLIQSMLYQQQQGAVLQAGGDDNTFLRLQRADTEALGAAANLGLPSSAAHGDLRPDRFGGPAAPAPPASQAAALATQPSTGSRSVSGGPRMVSLPQQVSLPTVPPGTFSTPIQRNLLLAQTGLSPSGAPLTQTPTSTATPPTTPTPTSTAVAPAPPAPTTPISPLLGPPAAKPLVAPPYNPYAWHDQTGPDGRLRVGGA